MRRALLIVASMLLLSSVLPAQTKYSSKWHCEKPSTNPVVPIGDIADHSYAIAQGDCIAVSSSIGEKTGRYTESQELWKSSYKVLGRFNVTLDNGDMIYHVYNTKGDQKSAAELWKIANATGSHKGTTGSGSCKGTINDDGTSDWECAGTMTAKK